MLGHIALLRSQWLIQVIQTTISVSRPDPVPLMEDRCAVYHRGVYTTACHKVTPYQKMAAKQPKGVSEDAKLSTSGATVMQEARYETKSVSRSTQ